MFCSLTVGVLLQVLHWQVAFMVTALDIAGRDCPSPRRQYRAILCRQIFTFHPSQEPHRRPGRSCGLCSQEPSGCHISLPPASPDISLPLGSLFLTFPVSLLAIILLFSELLRNEVVETASSSRMSLVCPNGWWCFLRAGQESHSSLYPMQGLTTMFFFWLQLFRVCAGSPP